MARNFSQHYPTFSDQSIGPANLYLYVSFEHADNSVRTTHEMMQNGWVTTWPMTVNLQRRNSAGTFVTIGTRNLSNRHKYDSTFSNVRRTSSALRIRTTLNSRSITYNSLTFWHRP